MGAEVLPRNFLGGLSRSPAAGSTTQRSSTSLGDKELSQWERRGLSPHSTPPSEQGVPGYLGGLQRNHSITDKPLIIKSLPFQTPWLKDRISWSGMAAPRKNTETHPAYPDLVARTTVVLWGSAAILGHQTLRTQTPVITLRLCCPDLKGQYVAEKGEREKPREIGRKTKSKGGRDRDGKDRLSQKDKEDKKQRQRETRDRWTDERHL